MSPAVFGLSWLPEYNVFGHGDVLVAVTKG